MKNSFYLGVILFALFFGMLIGCHKCGSPGADILTKVDTVYLHVKDSTGEYTPKITTIEPGRIPEPGIQPKPVVITDSFIVYKPGQPAPPVDTPASLNRYYQHVYYKDTVPTKYGLMRINDMITENRIASRQVFTDFVIPSVTKTVTVPVKKRNEIYAGMMVQGTELSPITHVGISAMLKTKRDKVFEVGALVNKNNQITYQAGFNVKISFRKK